MMCSIFPEKLIFEEKNYRTLSEEGFTLLLSNRNNSFKKKEKEQIG